MLKLNLAEPNLAHVFVNARDGEGIQEVRDVAIDTLKEHSPKLFSAAWKPQVHGLGACTRPMHAWEVGHALGRCMHGRLGIALDAIIYPSGYVGRCADI